MELKKKNGGSDSDRDYISFSSLLKTVMTSSDAAAFQRGQYNSSERDTPARKKLECAANAAEQFPLQPQSANLSPKLSNLSPTALPEQLQHLSSPRLKQALTIENDMPGILVEQQNQENYGCRPPQTGPVPCLETLLPTDGYGWRKYGQKQVKSSENSRSYYRCTYSGCPAKKKVLQCDRSRRVVDVVYLGHHNHAPPREKCRSSRGFVSAAKLAAGELIEPSFQKSDRFDFSVCSEDARKSPLRMRELEQPDSSSFNSSDIREPESKEFANGKRTQQNSTCGLAGIEVQEKPGTETLPRKRIKESDVRTIPVLKETKESIAVMHAVAGEGNSSDGYRWRKYGQKTLKGNSYVRSYYRCTSAGCSAHKQVERSTDDSTVTRMTYAGEHDHDVPLPKKWNGPKVYPCILSPAATMHDAESDKTGSLSDQRSNQWSNGVGEIMDERVLELGGEKALESAQTLLSIGFKVRPG